MSPSDVSNDRLADLTDYPFDRLRHLLRDIAPPDPATTVPLHIGEPRHPAPGIIAETLAEHAADWGRYPPPAGTPDYRAAAADWLTRRYHLPAGFVDPQTNVVAVAGTREALFLAALASTPKQKSGHRPAILLPNPFYQVYAGAAVMAGADPVLLPATTATGHQPDLDAVPPDTLDRTAAVYLNSPANPQGSVLTRDQLRHAAHLAKAHDFVLLVDECYAEIYCGDPPPGALEACAEAPDDWSNVVVFHSLSKRSNAPGLRCGFVAGAAHWIARFQRLRQYGGALVPMPILAAGAALWHDDAHVVANRDLYGQKFALAQRILGPTRGATPAGAFYLWLDVGDGEAATQQLWRDAGIKVMPGAYLARPQNPTDPATNPGASYIRVALVDDLATTERVLNHLAAAFPTPNSTAA